MVAPFGLSVLVLGESSYTKLENRGALLPPDRNDRIIDYVFRHEKDSTITRAAGVFYGEWRSWDQRCEFWRTTAFANFVQADMGWHGRRPTETEWEAGKEPLQEYLNDLQPKFVLVLGAELWEHLPPPCGTGKVDIDGKAPRPYYLYDHGGGCSFVFGINHPISRGWSYAAWADWVRAALKTAIKLRLG